MKKTYFTPIIMIEQQRLTSNILDNSNPYVNGEGNVEFPGGEGESGDADEGCAKEINEIMESEKDPFDNGLW